MKRQFSLILAALLCSFTGSKSLQADDFDFSPDPEILFGQLENGFRYALRANNEPPERVSVRLFVHAGSFMEEEHERGLAHFVEHMAFNGTENFAPGDMVSYFQRLGMAFGPDTNAYTGFDQTVYILEMPRNEEALLRDGFLLLRDYASGMLMLEEEIESERGVILNEKRFIDTVQYRTQQRLFEFILPKHLLPHRWPIGLASVIREADQQTFFDFYHSWYRPERMALIVVGDIDPEAIASLVEEFFADMEAAAPARPEPDLGTADVEGKHFGFHHEPEATRTSLFLLRTRQISDRPDSPEKRMDRLIEEMAFRILARRMDRIVRQEDSPLISASVYSNLLPGNVITEGFVTTLQPENAGQVIKLLENEIRKAIEFGFSEREVDEVFARVRNALDESVNTAPTRRSNDMARAILETIRFDEVFLTPEDERAMVLSMSDRITPENLHSAFLEVFGEGPSFVWMVSPEDITDAQEAMTSAWASGAKLEVESPLDNEVREFAYTEFGEPGDWVSMTEHRDLGIYQLRFANGFRLNFKQTEFEQGRIQVRLRFGRGLGDTPLQMENPALPLVADFVLWEGGLGEHEQDEIESIFAGQTLDFSFSVNEDHFSFSGVTRQQNLEDQLNLFTAFLTDPALRTPAIQRARNSFPIIHRQVQSTLEGLLQDRVARFLAGDHPLAGLPTPEEFSAIEQTDLMEWLEPIFMSGYAELSVVGDFDPESLVNIVRRTLGSLPTRQAWHVLPSDLLGLNLPESAEPVIFRYPTELERAGSVVVYPLTDGKEISLNRRLSMIRSILNDRMRIRIREELGDTYGVVTRMNLSDIHLGYGYIMFFTLTEPDRVEAVEEEVVATVNAFLKEGVNEDEFERALEPILASLTRSRRSNDYWLNTVLDGSQVNPFQIDFARTRDEDFRSITVEELSHLAKAFLNAEPLRIRLLPEGN